MALSTRLPSFGYQVAQGATTLWEDWSGTADVSNGGGNAPSHNHHFMGGIGQWLHSDLVGLSQGSGVAFSHPEIWPKIVNHSHLTEASGVWQTPRGEIRVAWVYAPRNMSVSVAVSTPPNTVATVVFPCVPRGTISDHGSAVWSHGKFQPGVPGVVGGATNGKSGLASTLVALQVSGGGFFTFSGACA